ncbi:MAG: carboxymuconolactone decarboxylase family protein [Gammaproteobacteria bacterium]|nr:carboxymuconolactone decarboxylase family protein [Gammaproteobacteria bacterium]
MLLTKRQQKLYDSFYESTHKNEHLDSKTELLVGLSAALAMNCAPCTEYYLKQAKKANVTKGEISEILAKVMAVSAGQKRLQMQDVLTKYDISLEALE